MKGQCQLYRDRLSGRVVRTLLDIDKLKIRKPCGVDNTDKGQDVHGGSR